MNAFLLKVTFLTGAFLVHGTLSYGEFGEEDLNEYRKSKAEKLRQWLEMLRKQEESQETLPLKKSRKKPPNNKRKNPPGSRQSMSTKANSSSIDDGAHEQEKLRWNQRLDNYSKTDQGFGLFAEGLLFLGPPALRGRQEFK